MPFVDWRSRWSSPFDYFGFQFGVVGVDLFFVLSGYLIGGILLDSRDQPGYFKSFFGRRAFRILPLYWLLLIVATPPHWGYYLFFAKRSRGCSTEYPFNEPAFISWSLAIEEQLYLLLRVDFLAYAPLAGPCAVVRRAACPRMAMGPELLPGRSVVGIPAPRSFG